MCKCIVKEDERKKNKTLKNNKNNNRNSKYKTKSMHNVNVPNSLFMLDNKKERKKNTKTVSQQFAVDE